MALPLPTGAAGTSPGSSANGRTASPTAWPLTCAHRNSWSSFCPTLSPRAFAAPGDSTSPRHEVLGGVAGATSMHLVPWSEKRSHAQAVGRPVEVSAPGASLLPTVGNLRALPATTAVAGATASDGVATKKA